MCLRPPCAGRSEDGGLSDSSAAFVTALVQERGLHAMALIVAEVEQTQQWPAAAEVRRHPCHLIRVRSGCCNVCQAWFEMPQVLCSSLPM